MMNSKNDIKTGDLIQYVGEHEDNNIKRNPFLMTVASIDKRAKKVFTCEYPNSFSFSSVKKVTIKDFPNG